ncbi:ATP-binding protein [Flavobacterium sp. FlaQc-47]|uniref:PAS domain-containing sensor histidine kinase n=1 Tax=Flavobacterium sp. FlaQc-47 TaxID=3374180 RepID=UPI0037570C22
MYLNIGLLNDIVNNTPLPIAVYSGNELKIELANAAMIKTWGKGDQVIGKKYLDVLPEIKNEDFFKEATDVLKTGMPFHGKIKRVDLVIDGIMTTHYFNYSFIPLINAEGIIYGVMNTGTDVTDLYVAQQKIKSSEERLKMAIDTSDLGTYEIDLTTKKLQTSGSFNSILSISTDASNEELIEKIHQDDLVMLKKEYENALITAKIGCQTRIINKDHTIKWVKIRGEVIKDENGKPTTIIGIIQDISEQREFEEELKKQVVSSTEELRRSNDDLLHFANVVSHDLREPVRKIKMYNNILRDEKNIDYNDNCKKYFQKIDHSAQRMQNLIEGILSYSTVGKNTQPVQPIDLNAVIENIKIDLELVIKEKGAILVGCDLPEIEGVPILISQLFYNLMQNALKFSKASEPPRVVITCSKTIIEGKDAVQIVIKDNGIGMDAAYAERIFSAFERLHSKDDYEGNGLGLALCRKIAIRHHGTITATGEKDNGAEFTVTLPLKQLIN